MSETTKMRAPYDDDEVRSLASHDGYAFPGILQELLAYRERYGDIDAPPRSPQAGDGVWLGDCEPNTHAQLRDRANLLDDIAALRAEVERRDEIIACEVGLRESATAENVELKGELANQRAMNAVIANDVQRDQRRLESLDAGCATLCRDLDAAKAEAARYRAAIVECITHAYNEATMLRTLALPLLTAEDRDVAF